MPPKKRKNWTAVKSSASKRAKVPLSTSLSSPILDANLHGELLVSKLEVSEAHLTGSPTNVSLSSTLGSATVHSNILSSPTPNATLGETSTPVLDDSEQYSVGSQINVSLSSTFDSSTIDKTSTPVLGGSEIYDVHTEESQINVASTSAEMDPGLLQAACQKIEMFLHNSWMCRVRNGGINVMLLSRKEQLAIQRTLFISPDGKVSLNVHCRPVAMPGNLMSDVHSPGPLTENSLNRFVDRCVKIVNDLRNFEICAGLDHAEYKHVWSTISLGKIDTNPYQESRYSETLRSNNCSYLVPVRRWRCNGCESLKKTARRKSALYSKEETAPQTPNVALSEEQKLRKFEEQKKKLDSCSRRLERMEEKLQKILITDGVHLDEDISNDLTDILKSNDLKPVHAFFLHQQMKASQARGPSGVRWHPDMIRFALALHMASPSAYATARDSGMIKLPSQRTLYDYTHVYDAKEGIDEHILQDVSKRVKNMPYPYQKYHVLTCDEMHICRNLVFRKSTGKMLGYAKLSEAATDLAALHEFLESGQSNVKPELASKMLCFMVKGVASNVKEVVASYSVNLLTTEFLLECTG